MDFIKPEGIRISMFELLITESCNQKCSYCFDNYFAERISGHDPSTYMHVEMLPDIMSFIDRVKDPNEKIEIHYIGGEPMVNREFFVESVKVLKDRYYPNINFSINTNLVILDDELLDVFTDNNFCFTVSLDGARESHNLHRMNWDKIMANLVKLNARFVDKYGPNHRRISVNDVISCDTVDAIEEDCKFLYDLHIPVSLGMNNEDNWNDELFARYKEKVLAVSRKYGIKNNHFASMGIVRLNNGQKHFCLQESTNVTINPQGKLFFCHRLTPKSYKMGDDFKYFYGDIWNGYTTDYYKLISDITSQRRMKEKCKTCDILNYCNTGCIACHYYVNDDYDSVSENSCKTMHIWHDITIELLK